MPYKEPEKQREYQRLRVARRHAKCSVRCRPCHIKITQERRGYNPHGQTGYKNGCRCEICTEAKRIEVQKYRASRVYICGGYITLP